MSIAMDWNYNVKNKMLSFFYNKGVRTIFVEREFHTFHEILYMYHVDAKLITEKKDIQIRSGDLIIIPKDTFHRLILEDPDTYHRCCFHFSSIEGLDRLIDTCTKDVTIFNIPSISALLQQVPAILDGSFLPEEESIYISALLVQVLLEIKRNLNCSKNLKSRDQTSLVYKALEYINSNYQKNIDLDSIATELAVSRSALAHRFKEELNTSVYKYILNKRMVHAHRLLRSGLSAKEVCEKSGYSDYTAFYRAYKSTYNETPTDTKEANK